MPSNCDAPDADIYKFVVIAEAVASLNSIGLRYNIFDILCKASDSNAFLTMRIISATSLSAFRKKMILLSGLTTIISAIQTDRTELL